MDLLIQWLLGMDKLDRFAKRFADEMNKSARSRYYRFGDWIIRISDHIATSSSFTMSIITPTVHSCGMYILHNKGQNTVCAIEYEDLKTLIKSFRILSGNKLTPAKLKKEQGLFEKERIKKYQKKISEQKKVIRSLTDKLKNSKKSKKTTSKT